MKKRIISAIKGILVPKTLRPAVAAPAPSVTSTCASKAYLRALRQAELQSWQRSGGDALASHSFRFAGAKGATSRPPMKTAAIVFLLASLAFVIPARGQEILPLPANQMRADSRPATPIFDGFIFRLQSCTGLFAQWAQWSKVMKPTLEELGYTREQVAEIRAKLGAHKATMADAQRFSELWLRKYGEQLDPVLIYRRLPHERAPEPSLAVR